MNTYKELQEQVEASIGKLDLNGSPRELYEPAAYMMGLGGKRLRPVLALMASDLFAGSIADAMPAALAIEVFHNFTLVHDDIMDQAALRRGKPTVHHKWNMPVAILTGDLMMIRATELLCSTQRGDTQEMLRFFNRTAIEVCEGQQLDMNFEQYDEVSRDEYIGMITLKTAVLIGCALKLGAMTAGADKQDAHNLYEFGKHIGIAFQIQDDMLDAFGGHEQTGKKVGGDIAANKKTLLFIEAMRLAGEQEKSALKHWLGQLNDDKDTKIAAVLRIFESVGVKPEIEKLKAYYQSKAFSYLEAVNVSNERKQQLINTANSLMERIS